jgi:hydroxypyruvate reductase
MAVAVEQHYACPLEGLVIVPEGYAGPTRGIEVIEAAHPVPDDRGQAAAQRILALVQGARMHDVILCLLSGGASALMVLPARGVTLGDKRTITNALLRAGAAISEINCVRKHLSSIKGGRLAAAARAPVVSLIISDVAGDDPAVIASGPTVPDPTTCADALGVLARYGIVVPDSLRDLLMRGALETPKVVTNPGKLQIIARPADAFRTAAAHARAHGLAVIDLGDRCEGEARAIAQEHAARARAATGPCVILSGGECVVTVQGEGRGGPNTEFALALAIALDGAPCVWGLSADTDGLDGAARAAGALVTPTTLARARIAGIDPVLSLNRNDSAGLFAALGDLVDPGPTRTNVNDFRAVLVLPPA